MSCVSRYVSTFVISVNDNVKSHELPEISFGEAKLIGVVGTIIKTGIWVWNFGVISIAIVVNNGSNSRYF